MIIKKQDIDELPYKELVGLTDVELETWVKQHKLSHFHTWLLPQMVAYFGSWTLAKTESGHIDILKTLKNNVGNDPKALVLWKLARLTRSQLLDLQNKHPEYGQLTPLILMGFKRAQNIQYEQWRGLPNLEYVLEPKLYEALVHQDYSWCDLGSDRLIEIRNQGLLNKAGVRAGEIKPAPSTWALTGVTHTEIGELPKLTQTILTQIWLAHPTKRTPYMILDFKNWDHMPDPLISNEIFQKQTAAPSKTNSKRDRSQDATLPWL